jgi:hypothetical protein
MPYRPDLRAPELSHVAQAHGLEPNADIDAITDAIAQRYDAMRAESEAPPEPDEDAERGLSMSASTTTPRHRSRGQVRRRRVGTR